MYGMPLSVLLLTAARAKPMIIAQPAEKGYFPSPGLRERNAPSTAKGFGLASSAA